MAEAPERPAPVVSIVIATYHRPQVLDFAIRSVLQSTFSDWELIVVGDGCTDETEACVRSFRDPRISWHNLPVNSGNQAAPNNAGITRARGRYVLFLNQDDLWFGDHLAHSIDILERTGADVTFSPVAALAHSARDEGPPDPDVDRIVLRSVAPNGYDPRVFVNASSWTVRRTAFDRVGPWHLPSTTRLSPSQEWLFRAARAGCRIVYDPRVSVLCIYAGTRRLSYLRDSPEHVRAWEWVRGRERPDSLLLETIALSQAVESYLQDREALSAAPDLRERIYAGVARVAERLGAHPHAVERFLRREAKGTWIADVQRYMFDALPLIPGEHVRPGETLDAGYLVSGWHAGDTGRGVWSNAKRATVGFRVPDGMREPVLEVTGGPLRPGPVVFGVRGGTKVRRDIADTEHTVQLPLGAGGGRDVVVTIEVDGVSSPQALGMSMDPRELGFGLTGLRLVERNSLSDGVPA
jgi:GT2 family glycosyltransferase